MAFKSDKNKYNSKSGMSQNGNQNAKRNGNPNSGRSNRINKFNNKPSKFKFQLHDGGNKKAYTCDKIKEAIILKIQTEFQSARFIMTSLRKRIKEVPPTPSREASNRTDKTERVIK